jgi:hypothetical protein
VASKKSPRGAADYKETSAKAHFKLGEVLTERAERGSSAKRDLMEAYGHFRACYELDPLDQGFLTCSMHRVAIALWDGQGCAMNRSESLRLLRKNAEEHSYAPSMNSFASRLAMGDCVRQDVAKALQLWERAAVDGGETTSMESLAEIYLEGKFGVPKDLSQAARWATLGGGDYLDCHQRIEAAFESPEAFRECCAKHRAEAKKHSKLVTAPLFPGTRIRLSRTNTLPKQDWPRPHGELANLHICRPGQDIALLGRRWCQWWEEAARRHSQNAQGRRHL